MENEKTKLEKRRQQVLDEIKTNGLYLEHYKEFKQDYEIVWEAVKSKGYALKYAHNSYKNDEQFVKLSIDNNDCSSSLALASDRIKDNKEMVMYALSKIQNSR